MRKPDRPVMAAPPPPQCLGSQGLTCLPGSSSYCQRASGEGARKRQRVHLWPPLVFLPPTADTVQTHTLNCKARLFMKHLLRGALLPHLLAFCPGSHQTHRTTPISPRLCPVLTLLEHAHPQALGEAAGLTGLASPLGDLTLIGGRTAVLDAPCQEEAGLQWRPPRARRGPR